MRTNALSVPIQSVTTRLPVVAGLTNSARTNAIPTTEIASTGKTNDLPKPVEIVFVLKGDHVKSVPVKHGISDDNYTEITEGLQEGDLVVSGGYKAINRDLEDGKKVVMAEPGAAGKPKAAAN
jgi:HlyD family secretion protein